mmetsp:Transcript_66468/g.188703  ORF Transcript_66468/g.188703 Transcript_66468/m.188703 type:complete len:147 (+) Transcript_66468:78-518(+)
MGQAASRCCNQAEATALHEQKDFSIRKEPPPGAGSLPFEGTTDPAATTLGSSKSSGRKDEYCIALDKTQGQRLGIDVDHQDGSTLLIEYINGGLVEAWNRDHPDRAVRQGDRIVEVNNIHDDVVQMVESCKQHTVLHMRVRRAVAP